MGPRVLRGPLDLRGGLFVEAVRPALTTKVEFTSNFVVNS